ncbi:hypothetical protein ME9_00175 [Bartonella taylorii 8TBB]|uniref:Uncharacterized protein n=1 Tax=Bartonella taylorii 8TBB TaxID=1094560 RepID=A0A9P2W3J1_BARTA|nr:hypothetical protein ME9_00175 [Bartonella taylorii 8TBB]
MNNEGSLVGVSFVTTAPYFSLVPEIGNRSVKDPLHPSDSLRTAVESEYKSQLYKLWQSLKKNKPSMHNNSALCSNNKKHCHIQPVSASYQLYSETVKSTEYYIKSPVAMHQQKEPWFRFNLSFYNSSDRSIGRSNISRFLLPVYKVERMLAYIKNVFRKNKIYSHKKQDFGLSNLTLQIYGSSVWRQLENLYSTRVSICKFFCYRVYC